MPGRESNGLQDDSIRESKEATNGNKEELAAILRDLSSPRYPTAPPNSAVPRKIRLVHSAPKYNSRNDLQDDQEEDIPEKEEDTGNNLENDPVESSNQTPHPAYTPVFFQIATSMDILTSNPRQTPFRKSSESPMKDMGANILNYKPGYSRHPSPKKVKFLENYNHAKLSDSLNTNREKVETDGHSVRSSSTKGSDTSRRNLHMSHCEAMLLSDLKQNYGALNKSVSKSVHSLNVAPRPVAAFPGKPLKAGSFVLARRKGNTDLNRTKSQVSLNDIKIGPDLSVYSIQRTQIPQVDNFDTDSVLPSLEDLDNKENSDTDLLLRKSELETPVPYNSCKTSMVGSDTYGRPESVLATRGTMRPWSGTMDGFSDTQSDISNITKQTDGQQTTRSRTTTRKSSALTELSSAKSPRAPVSINAFRPSKSVHKLNASQAYANYNVKHRKENDEKHKAIIMDIFKKRGMKVPNHGHNNQGNIKEDERRYTGYARFREERKPKQRSRSLGRDESKERDKTLVFYDNEPQNKMDQPNEKGHPLAILASRGGRDVLFNSRFKYKKSGTYQYEKLAMSYNDISEKRGENTKSGNVDDKRKIDQEKTNKVGNINNNEPVKIASPPFVTFSDKIETLTETNIKSPTQLQGASSLQRKKLATDTAKSFHSSTEAMFDASHYSGFQHAKFSKKERDLRDTRRKQQTNNYYNEDMKSKFLKVSVGGAGTGIASDSMDSPRSSELTVS